MNKMHTLARIVVFAMGLYFAVSLIKGATIFANSVIFMCLRGMSRSAGELTIAIVFAVFPILCTGVICYLCLCRHERIAERIVGTHEPAEPNSQIDWLPVAFRLACVVAGLYCLYTVLWGTLGYIQLYFSSRNQGLDITSRLPNLESLLTWFVPLPIGIYLICGAPHFVRWHVRKTLEQCQLLSAKVGDSKGS